MRKVVPRVYTSGQVRPSRSIPTVPTTGWTVGYQTEKVLDAAGRADARVLVGACKRTFTIFEGTSEIQRLVIARAITGLHIQ
jgi:alkylation response protein AidB-like acyl-CoA dehydrogenase